MEVPITQFRREIFSFANRALDGGEVWFTHKGRRLKVVPEDQPVSRLSRITPMEILNSEFADLNSHASNAEIEVETKAETKKAWESDWFIL